jgi:hypothetical protein
METPKQEEGLIGMVMNLISFIRKYFLILLAFLALGTYFGIRSYYKQQSMVMEKLVVNTSFIDNDIVAKLVNALQLYVENGDTKGLAEKMETSPENVSCLSRIFADTTKAKLNAIRVDLSIGDANKIDSINKGLITYLNNNEYIHSVIALRIDQRNLSISSNKKRLNILDSLYTKNAGNLEQATALGEESRALLSEIQKAEYENLAYRSIYVLEKNASAVPIRPLRNSLLMSLVAYLFMGLAISAIIEVLRLYIKREKQKKSETKA